MTSIYRGRLTEDLTGKAVDVVLSVTGVDDPLPPPVVKDPNRAVIGSTMLVLAGTNIDRTENALVRYMTPLGVTTTNRWGVEITVRSEDGRIVGYRDRQKVADGDTGTVIPAGCYVLSGHGTTADALRLTAQPGVSVSLLRVDNPVPPPSGSGYPAREIAVYKMMWSSNGPAIGTLPAEFNVVRLAFAQGSPPKLVGWGAEGQQGALAGMAAKAAAGVRFVVSLGGQGGACDLANRATFMTGLAGIVTATKGLVTGLDIDVEASALPPQGTLDVIKACRDTYGPDFSISFAPNGGNVGQYLPVAASAVAAGLLDSYGQQFYDAPVSTTAAADRITEAIKAGIPIGKISVGMMIGSDPAKYWTNAQCAARVRDLRAQFPGLSRVYLWEAGRPGTGQFATDMKAIIG